jgi:predicted acetyltransferase
MPTTLHWASESDIDRVATARLRAYSPAAGRTQKYHDSVRVNPTQKAGDMLLAVRDGIDVGTATALSLRMAFRGSIVPCQGVAYVGTIKTARRASAVRTEPGIASLIMNEVVRKAREREEVITALMPFRASFYEHFGFGNAERRVEWTVPLAVMPKPGELAFRFYEPLVDDALIRDLRQREFLAGHCDVESHPDALEGWKSHWNDGMVVIDQPRGSTQAQGFAFLLEERGPERATVVVEDWCCPTPDALQRLLQFLGTLKDQYTNARITLPADAPLNRMLREAQVPHRQVDHPVASCRPYTRMQLRVLDHRRLLERMKLSSTISGRAVVRVHECEGHESTFEMRLDAGRIDARPSEASPAVECSDVVWASLVSGDLPARDAARFGLATFASHESVTLIDAFSQGTVPFCQEYF